MSCSVSFGSAPSKPRITTLGAGSPAAWIRPLPTDTRMQAATSVLFTAGIPFGLRNGTASARDTKLHYSAQARFRQALTENSLARPGRFSLRCDAPDRRKEQR